MKKTYLLLLLFCFSYFPLSGQNTKIKLTKIKINSKDKYPFKGYLYDVDEDKVILIPKRKGVKQFLISGNCETCYAIPREFIRDLKFSQKKPFQPYGLMVSVGLGLILVTTADNTPNPDGLNGRDIAGFYTLMGITIGGITDIIRLATHFNGKNTVDINMVLPSVLLQKSAMFQFNKQRDEQLNNLMNIFAHIEQNNANYRKKMKVYTKDNKLISGYIIGQQNDTLLLSTEAEKLIAYRKNPPDNLSKILFKNILYYEFEN